jgi:hypothetical protein
LRGHRNDHSGLSADRSFEIQPALVYGFGRLALTFHLQIHCVVQLVDGVALRLLGLIPTSAARIRGDEGSAEVRIGWVALGIFYTFLPPQHRLQPSIGLAMAPGIMRLRGNANGAFRDSEDWVIFPLGLVVAGLAVALTKVVSVRIDAGVGLAMKRPVIGFADRIATGWGRPLLFGMVGIEAWLF